MLIKLDELTAAITAGQVYVIDIRVGLRYPDRKIDVIGAYKGDDTVELNELGEKILAAATAGEGEETDPPPGETEQHPEGTRRTRRRAEAN